MWAIRIMGLISLRIIFELHMEFELVRWLLETFGFCPLLWISRCMSKQSRNCLTGFYTCLLSILIISIVIFSKLNFFWWVFLIPYFGSWSFAGSGSNSWEWRDGQCGWTGRFCFWAGKCHSWNWWGDELCRDAKVRNSPSSLCSINST